MTIPSAAAKYGLGTTYINSANTYYPLKGMWIKNADGTWHPVKTGWVCHDDGSWERIYPTPAGVFTPNIPFISANTYQNHTANTTVALITNTGDYDLTINSISINDDVNGNYTTLSNVFPKTPITLVPGATTTVSTTIYGNNVAANINGNLSFTLYTGHLGYANVVYPVSANVIPDYNGIAANITTFNLVAYEGDLTNVYGNGKPGTFSYTVPSGVTSIYVELEGGGGGGGASSSNYPGAFGNPGHKLYGNLSVTAGDVIVANIGGGGQFGLTGVSGAGGVGGPSYNSYGGGAGSNSGPNSYGGGGGGGGAASVLQKNGAVIAVAAGGGGGGGAGSNGPGNPQSTYSSSGSNIGAVGTSNTNVGGGAGGGGGGNYGGAGGAVPSSDTGANSGSDGADLVPANFAVSYGTNNGTSDVASYAGSFKIIEVVKKPYNYTGQGQNAFTITNTGNGKNLSISNYTSQNGYCVPSALPALPSVVGYNFSTNTGNSAVINLGATTLPAGVYQDNLIVTSDALNAANLTIPVTVNVQKPSGFVAFDTPGTYTWRVPQHVYFLRMLIVGSGGGGGSSVSNYTVLQGGSGGGGGSGGYQTHKNLKVTPGELLTITVGAPGGTGSQNVNIFYVTNYNSSWSSFMNDNAVWFSPDGASPIGDYVVSDRQFIAPIAGTYTFTAQADNNMYVVVDGTQLLIAGSATTSTVETLSLTPGKHDIHMLSVNYSGTGGFALTITDPNSNVIWTTRSLLNPTVGSSGGDTIISGSFGTYGSTGGSPGTGAYNDGVQPSGYYSYDGGGWDASTGVGVGVGVGGNSSDATGAASGDGGASA